MKKIIALILAIVMIASMSVVAFAANGDATNDLLEDELAKGENRDLLGDEEPVEVIYDVRLGYEVIIPGDFNLTESDPNAQGYTHGEGSGKVIITLAKLPGGHELTVKASATNAKLSGTPFGNWTLAVDGTTDTLAYKIGVAGDDTGVDDHDTADLVRDSGVIVSHKSGYDPAVTPYVAGQGGAAGTGGRSADLTITTADNDVAGYFKDTITFKTAVTGPTNS